MTTKVRQADRILRLALFGAGRIGMCHAANIVTTPGLQLVAVHDPSVSACRKIHKITDASIKSTKDIYSDPDIDAVIIASPASSHTQQALECAKAGKAFLCEKPLANDLAGTRKVVKAVRAAKIPAMIAFNRRFDRQFLALREHLRSGDLGQLEMLRLTSRSETPPPLAYARQSGGLLRDKGSHFFDLACWLAGHLPATVFASGTCLFDKQLAKIGDVDSAMLILTMNDGTMCQFDFSRRAAYGHDERIEAFGSKGMAVVAMHPNVDIIKSVDTHSTITCGKRRNWMEYYAPTYVAELKAFANAVRSGGRNMPVPLDAGLLAEAIATAALRSLRTQRAVDIDITNIDPKCCAA